jgi:hypothetical protein
MPLPDQEIKQYTNLSQEEVFAAVTRLETRFPQVAETRQQLGQKPMTRVEEAKYNLWRSEQFQQILVNPHHGIPEKQVKQIQKDMTVSCLRALNSASSPELTRQAVEELIKSEIVRMGGDTNLSGAMGITYLHIKGNVLELIEQGCPGIGEEKKRIIHQVLTQFVDFDTPKKNAEEVQEIIEQEIEPLVFKHRNKEIALPLFLEGRTENRRVKTEWDPATQVQTITWSDGGEYRSKYAKALTYTVLEEGKISNSQFTFFSLDQGGWLTISLEAQIPAEILNEFISFTHLITQERKTAPSTQIYVDGEPVKSDVEDRRKKEQKEALFGLLRGLFLRRRDFSSGVCSVDPVSQDAQVISANFLTVFCEEKKGSDTWYVVRRFMVPQPHIQAIMSKLSGGESPVEKPLIEIRHKKGSKVYTFVSHDPATGKPFYQKFKQDSQVHEDLILATSLVSEFIDLAKKASTGNVFFPPVPQQSAHLQKVS